MTEVTSARVYLRHLRAVKPKSICHSGARSWWESKGLSWSDFISNGIDGQTLLDTKDANAVRVVRIAEQEAAGGR